MSPIQSERARKSTIGTKTEATKSNKTVLEPPTTIKTGFKTIPKKKNENEVDSYAGEYYKKNVQVAFYREKIHQSAQDLLPRPGTIKPLLDPLAIVQRPQETFRQKVAVEAKLKNILKDPTIHDVLYGMRDKGKVKSKT
jgi:hypothetical protein